MRIFTTILLLFALSVSAFASQNKKQVKLRIQASTGNLDETSVYFDQGINNTYNYQEDAQKVLSGVAGVPVIYSVTSDNVHCSINGYSELVNTEEVTIGVSVDVSATYNITCPLLDNFNPTSIITLEDRQIGRFIDLRTNFYQVFLDSGATAEGRFYLHVSYPSAISSTVAGCSNDDAQISVVTDTSITWDAYELYDAANNLITSYNNVHSTVHFTGLAQGTYHFVCKYGAYNTTQEIQVNGNFLQAGINASATQVATYENISFSAVANNANHFEWDFGDGTLINGVAHPDLAYYEPGVYTVTLHCSNDHGCSDDATIQIIVSQSQATGITETENKEISVTAINRNLTVDMNSIENKGAILQVFNLLGQPVNTTNIHSTVTNISLDTQPSGYYLASVKNGNIITTKRIFIGR